MSLTDRYDMSRAAGERAVTLLELNSMVAGLIDTCMPDAYWVEAELSEMREVRGHCYMELVQKDAASNTPVAKAQARCWATQWRVLRPRFERVTGQCLRAGMKVMLLVHAQFHAAYGFSWIVDDINPEFTMGDLARRRREIVERLRAEGVLELQSQLVMSPFAQRVAVVSSAGAAGYGDFCSSLRHNACGYAFSIELFPAVMQGEEVESSVIAALELVYERQEDFDVVVIIRGGGATSDLSGFDTLLLAEHVANFPLPIVTGIGHDRDESVLDIVAHRKVKTPTAAAQLLVDNLAATDAVVESCRRDIYAATASRMEREQLRLKALSKSLPTLFSLVRARQTSAVEGLAARIHAAVRHHTHASRSRIDLLAVQISGGVAQTVTAQRHRLQMLERSVDADNPVRLLRRGYSITTYKGKAVRDPHELPEGAEVVTRVEKGEFKSTVKKTDTQ